MVCGLGHERETKSIGNEGDAAKWSLHKNKNVLRYPRKVPVNTYYYLADVQTRLALPALRFLTLNAQLFFIILKNGPE
jgi:hypothetical protein